MAQVIDMEGSEKREKLRKAVSDLSHEMEKYCKMESDSSTGINIFPSIDEEVKEVECKCCGMKEECTSAYISEVEECYGGEWLCGLCSAAVKDRAGKDPRVSLRDALKFHRDFCFTYNTTTRINPKLYLTLSMRDIAKKSSEKRKSKLARSTSYP